jgi:hypothetical protein
MSRVVHAGRGNGPRPDWIFHCVRSPKTI